MGTSSANSKLPKSPKGRSVQFFPSAHFHQPLTFVTNHHRSLVPSKFCSRWSVRRLTTPNAGAHFFSSCERKRASCHFSPASEFSASPSRVRVADADFLALLILRLVTRTITHSRPPSITTGPTHPQQHRAFHLGVLLRIPIRHPLQDLLVHLPDRPRWHHPVSDMRQYLAWRLMALRQWLCQHSRGPNRQHHHQRPLP